MITNKALKEYIDTADTEELRNIGLILIQILNKDQLEALKSKFETKIVFNPKRKEEEEPDLPEDTEEYNFGEPMDELGKE